MAGQPVLQKVSPELEVILVAGLFVPDREGSTHFKGFTRLYGTGCDFWK